MKAFNMGSGILKGLRVLDLSRMLSGPYCTMLLADHGAEVIKVEAPHGDTSRATGPFRPEDQAREWSGYFVSLNRNKKSIVLDLKKKKDKSQFQELVKTSDIVVENFRPGVMEKLGIGYKDLSHLNPKLVYGAIADLDIQNTVQAHIKIGPPTMSWLKPWEG